jgi:hypothetical protein
MIKLQVALRNFAKGSKKRVSTSNSRLMSASHTMWVKHCFITLKYFLRILLCYKVLKVFQKKYCKKLVMEIDVR